VHREWGFARLVGVFRRAALVSAIILFILAGSSLFAWVLTRARVANLVAERILSLTTSPALVTMLIILFLLGVDCFMAVAVSPSTC
ncbi:MAG: TRAP transporter large permease subunit, partial [Pseudomonadota bacterium]